MAKAKSKRRKKSSGGGSIQWGASYSGTRRRRDRRITAAVVAVAVIGGGLYWWLSAGAERDFMALAGDGQAALKAVKTLPSDGRGHLRSGQQHHYRDRFPTSGIHSRGSPPPGFYEVRLQPTQLVHAVEHGNIVIYYDKPGAAALATLKKWAKLYAGRWDGVLATRAAGLGGKVVLTAWTRRLDQEQFDAAGAAAFIDAYRGRGPEHPVR